MMMKKNKRSIIINLIILVLLILISLIQVIKVWFGIQTYPQLMEFIIPTKVSSVVDKERFNEVNPSSIAITEGEDKLYYTVSETSAVYTDLYRSYLNILKTTINKNSINKYETSNFEYTDKHILVLYPFEVTKKQMLASFSINANSDFPETFDDIIVSIATKDIDEISVYVHNTEDDYIYEYNIKKEDVFIDNEILSYILEDKSYDEGIGYVSSRKAEYDFSNLFLLPKNGENLTVVNNINPYIPFITEEKIDTDSLTDFVSVFFGGSNISGSVGSEDNVVFTDNRAVVKYNKDGLLEYISGYKSDVLKEDFIKDFSVVSEFINKKIDKSLIEYYIDGYEYLEDGLHFYYNVGYNKIIWQPTASLQKKYNIKTPIEVVIKNGEVVYFRWLVRLMPELIKQPEVIKINYKDILRDIDKENTKKIALVYKWEKEENQLGLYLAIYGLDDIRFIEVESEF